jgi:hypothetical protein
MTIQYEEVIDSREVVRDKDGLIATRIFKAYSDGEAPGDPDDFHKMLDPEEVAVDSGIIPIGTPHPVFTDLLLKEVLTEQNTETTNRCFVTYTYAEGERGNPSAGRSTPDANNEIWTFNMISQTKTITAVLNDGKGKPKQMTYDGETPGGAQKYNAINFGDQSDGVAGVSVYRPTETVSVTKFYPDLTDVNQSYRETLRSLQNTVNDSTWPSGSEYKAGELLFIGSDISYNIEEGSATVNYTFQAGNTQKIQKLTVWKDGAQNSTDTEEVILHNVKPFQQVWAPVMRKLVKKDGVQKPVFNLKSVNVADVYEYADFSRFKIVGD